MVKIKSTLLGTALMGAALVSVAGIARAQDYYGHAPYQSAPYQTSNDGGAYQREYDRAMGTGTESVIVRPDSGYIEKRQVIGHVNGEINPTEYVLSQPVGFSDLDLSNPADRAELRIRIHETAQDLCAELDARVPGLRGDRSAARECVRNAARDAMRDVYG